jgi:NTE family protein
MHAGVLQALAEARLPIGFLSGCSIGAWVGAWHAAGHPPRSILSLLEEMPRLRLIRPAWRGGGLLCWRPLADWLARSLPARFEDLGLPLAVNATDLRQGRTVYFSEGPLAPALAASACLPGLFAPQERNGLLLADGGILDNLPTAGLPDAGFRRWASSCNEALPISGSASLPRLVERTLNLAINQNTQAGRAACERVIAPTAMGQFRIFQFSQIPAMQRIGYEAAWQVLREEGLA